MPINIKMVEGQYGQVFEGECDQKTLRSTSLLGFLGIELIARTEESDLLDTCKEAFTTFSAAGNDAAAKDALDAVTRLQEATDFFDWIDSTYWLLPLYQPDYWEEKTNCEYYFELIDKLKLTKSAVMDYVAGIWARHDDDLGLRALNFLCDCYDENRFKQRAKSVIAGVNSFQRTHRFKEEFNLPKADKDAILSCIRSSMPTQQDVIQNWINRVRGKVPGDIWKLFGHAFVNAGGEVLTS